MKKVFFYSSDGLRLCGIWHVPQKKVRKAIILAHGITVDKNEDDDIFVSLGNLLCHAGYAVLRFDFRGSGDSEGNSIDMTIQGEINDLSGAVNHVIQKGYDTVGLLGASFGGAVSVLYTSTEQQKITCLCLWNPVLNFDHVFLNPRSSWLKESSFQMKSDISGKGWTELGSRKFKVGKRLFEEMETIYPYEALAKIRIPTAILHGTKDTHVPFADSRKYINKVGKLIVLDGADHGFSNSKDEQKNAIDATLDFFNLKMPLSG